MSPDQIDYHRLYDESPGGQVSVLKNGEIIDCNQAFAKLVGLAKESVVGKTRLSDFLTPGGRIYFESHFYPIMMLHDAVSELNFELVRPNDERVPTLVSAVNIFGATGQLQFMQLNVIDIRQRKSYEQELLTAKRNAALLADESAKRASALAALNHDLEQLMYIVAHDLQEPLRTIINFIEIVQEDHQAALGEEGQRVMGVIANAAQRQREMIRTLLDHSRVGNNQAMVTTSVGKVLDDCVVDLQLLIKETEAVIDVGDMPTIKAYPVDLKQLFQNLISNALKFRRKGVAPIVTVRAQSASSGHTFQVADNGIGIAPSQLERVFEIFHRLHSPKEYPGYGIGLANCRKIVRLHQGNIWIESQLGLGTTVFFSLPEL